MPLLAPIVEAGLPTAPTHTTRRAAIESLSVISTSRNEAQSSLNTAGKKRQSALNDLLVLNRIIRPVRQSFNLGIGSYGHSSNAFDITSGDSFVILADLLEASIAGTTVGFYGAVEINARLTVNGTEIPIQSFNYQAPTGKLGSLLNVKLLRPDDAQVPIGSSVTFELLVKTESGWASRTLIDNGKMSSRDYRMSFRSGANAGPNDELSIGSMDVISDKFGLTPKRPVVLYDPARVKYADIEVDPVSALREESNHIILPIVEAAPSLTMANILNRAYKKQLGFERVITNIQNYPVRRADFTIEGGWHEGAIPCVAMYAPLYFVENNCLYILDADKQLPYGVVPHDISLAQHKLLSEAVSYKPDSNSLILTYQYSADEENPIDVYTVEKYLPAEEDESGTYGQSDYTRTTTTRRMRYTYAVTDLAQENPLSELELELTVETRQAITWLFGDADTGEVTETRLSNDSLTHSEQTVNSYEGELKIGHTKTTSAIIYVGEEAQSYIRPILNEYCTIYWKDDPSGSGQKVQSRSVIRVEGVCFAAEENETLGDGTIIRRLYPALLAQSSGIVERDAVLFGMRPISTTTQTLRRLQGNQFDVAVVTIDHLNNTVKRSTTSPTIGSNKTDPYQVRSRSIILRDAESEDLIGTRIPATANAYELPRRLALALGHNILKRLKNPLRQIPIDLVGVDFAVHRGSVIRAAKRNGNTGNYFVTGFGISGNNLGRDGHRISMSLETTELLEN